MKKDLRLTLTGFPEAAASLGRKVGVPSSPAPDRGPAIEQALAAVMARTEPDALQR
jgi:hypothetical protein